jgi:hypothetical protein
MDRDDLIKRSDAIDAVKEYLNLCCLTGAKFHKEAKDYNEEIAIEIFENIPAVEPWDLYDCDEWCRDCKEYDTERHNCPRWNSVIRRTLEENQPKQGEWIEMGENKDYTHNIKCSYCNMCTKSKGHANSYYTKHIMRYCPSCGAKMKGAGE